MNKKLDVIVDLQFGSTGKGALAGYLSGVNDYDTVISINQPNAGHTAYSPLEDIDGNQARTKFIHKVLPSGIFSGSLKTIGIGPGSIFSAKRLGEELVNVDRYLKTIRSSKFPVTVLIHENSVILTEKHAETEKATLNHISGTMQGSAAAACEKMMRISDIISKNNLPGIRHCTGGLTMVKVRVVSNSEWIANMIEAKNILLEGSQGYSLGLNAGFYPYCTSRDCTPARTISEAGLPLDWLRHVYGSARTYPIRVGNTVGGYSGDCYDDQSETTFESLGVEAEYTTVTGRQRRIFTFSMMQIIEACMVCCPDFIFLNFANYMDPREYDSLVQNINDTMLNYGLKSIVKFEGHGPFPEDIVDNLNSVPVKNTFHDVTTEIVEWVKDIIPDEGRDVFYASIKGIEELAELQLSLYESDMKSAAEEIADVLIIILDIAYLLKIDAEKAIKDKLKINKNRNWKIVNGTLKHIGG